MKLADLVAATPRRLQATELDALAELLGLEETRGRRGPCPTCGGKLGLWERDDEPLFRCWGCGERFGDLRLVHAVEGLDWPRAAAYLVEHTDEIRRAAEARPERARSGAGGSGRPRPEIASIDVRDRVYRRLLAAVGGAPRREGVPDAYARMCADFDLGPAERHEVTVALVAEFGADTLLRVPGFVPCERPLGPHPGDFDDHDAAKLRKARQWEECEGVALVGLRGTLLPVLDPDGRVQGLRVRRRDDRPPKYRWLSSNGMARSWLHVPRWAGATEVVRVTEGEFKAEIATARTGILTVSVPGVSCVREVVPVLRRLGAQRVLIAFDADKATNDGVAAAERRLEEKLLSEGFAVQVEWWDAAFKGIDDALLAGAVVSRLAGAVVLLGGGDRDARR